jgi:16S rRNA processing protein RimM
LSSSSNDLVPIGRVGRSHGRDGSFVVERASTAAERFAVDAVVYVDGQPARILASKQAGGRPVVRLDRKAERGAALAVPRAELPLPPEDTYYVFELVGLAVEEEGGRPLGRVAEVAPGVANDVLELDSGLALPLVDECVRAIDVEAGRIVIAPGFADPG